MKSTKAAAAKALSGTEIERERESVALLRLHCFFLDWPDHSHFSAARALQLATAASFGNVCVPVCVQVCVECMRVCVKL